MLNIINKKENAMKKRIRRSKIRIPLLPVLLITMLLFSALRLEKLLRPVITEQAQHFAEKTSAEIVEGTVSDYLRDTQYKYSDFAAVLYDDKKQISSVEALSYNINKVQSELTYLINQRLKKAKEVKTTIPIGSLTQTCLLNGKGPKIHIKLYPLGAADVSIKSELTGAGINQTKHSISAVIGIKLTSSTPVYKFNSETKFEFLIAETVIIGNVPNISPFYSQK